MSLHLVADLEANYARFVDRVRSSGTVWGLKNLNGWAICPSNEHDCDLYVFWSDEAYAKQHCKDGWANYKPAPIALDSSFGTGWPDWNETGTWSGFNSIQLWRALRWSRQSWPGISAGDAG